MPKFIVIETWPRPESALPVCNPDTGETMVFQTEAEAQVEADQCQQGRVVPV